MFVGAIFAHDLTGEEERGGTGGMKDRKMECASSVN